VRLGRYRRAVQDGFYNEGFQASCQGFEQRPCGQPVTQPGDLCRRCLHDRNLARSDYSACQPPC
jgi:hypothetical protein